MTKELLLKRFGNSWYEPLKVCLESKEFSNLGRQIATLRLNKVIYPSKELVFRAFRETPYDKIKVVLVGQDCYHDGSAEGLSFSNGMSDKVSPSLRLILEEIDNSYPEWKEDIGYGRLDKQDLSRWAKQGVFLINMALTVEEKKAGSHLKLWEPFINFVFSTINNKQDVIWILLGKEAQKIKSLITNKTHTILEAAHPAVHCYGESGFLGSNVFKECNIELELRSKQIIQW